MITARNGLTKFWPQAVLVGKLVQVYTKNTKIGVSSVSTYFGVNFYLFFYSV